jgi:uncharacterized C2H2 Zn-finger protein
MYGPVFEITMTSDESSFKCFDCSAVFKHRSSRSRHSSRCKGKQSAVGQTHVTVNTTELFEREPTEKVHDRKFEAWANMRISNGLQELMGKTISSSTAKVIDTFYRQESIEWGETIWDSANMFMDTIDLWIFEETKKVQASTVGLRLGYLWWIAQWRIDEGFAVPDGVIEYIDENREEMQRAGNMHRTNQSVLAMADPYELCKLSNRIVSGLQVQQRDTIDPFIRRHVFKRDIPCTEEFVKFGLDLRCWLDLAMRFVNVPARIQCTSRLEVPSSTSTDYVAKLVCHGSSYVRVLNKDKVCSAYEATQIPLCKTISLYMFYYLRFCRPKSSLPYVFLSKMGSRWAMASADIKGYVEEKLKVDPLKVEPGGRFVHGSRHIGLACFAVATGFDLEKLRCYTVLMRHSLSMAEQIYCPWVRLWQAKKAVEEFGRFRGLQEELQVLPHFAPGNASQETPFILLGLRKIPDAIFSVLSDQMLKNFKRDMAVPCYAQSDASTQTDTSDLYAAQEMSTQSAENSMQAERCGSCNEIVVYEGPYPVKRDIKRYGRFCKKCSCTNGKNVFLDLGMVPAQARGMKRPRNIDEIREYVQEKTGKCFEF